MLCLPSMNTAAEVSRHYRRERLRDTILNAVMKTAGEGQPLTVEGLAPMDEFHVGGLEATRHLAGQLDLHAGLAVLDVGSGIGGPARFCAAEYRCKVTRSEERRV